MLRRTLSITLATIAAAAVVGCSLADSPTGPQTLPPTEGSNSLLGSLTGTVTNLVGSLIMTCDKLPAQSVTQTIGSNGGTINVGPHTLVIPRGALKSNVKITAQVPNEKVSSVRFLPEGLKFSKPATLTLSYAHCKKLLPLPARVVYTTESLNILQLLRSLDNGKQKTVTAPLDHFSRYAVAYRDAPAEESLGLREEGDEDGHLREYNY